MNLSPESLDVEGRKSTTSWMAVLDFMAADGSRRITNRVTSTEPNTHLLNAARDTTGNYPGSLNVLPLIERWLAIIGADLETAAGRHEAHRARMGMIVLKNAAIVGGENEINPHFRLAHDMRELSTTKPDEYVTTWFHEHEETLQEIVEMVLANPAVFSEQQSVDEVFIRFHQIVINELDRRGIGYEEDSIAS